jgi:hypothetical protein
MSWTAMPPRPPYSASASLPTTDAICNCGHPCTCCQINVGEAITAAMAPPNHNIGRRRSSRGPATATATSSTEHSSITWSLVSAAMPATQPNAISSRSSRSRTHRISNHISSSHSAGSSA